MRVFYLKNIHYRPNLDKIITLVLKDVIEQDKTAKDKALIIDVTRY